MLDCSSQIDLIICMIANQFSIGQMQSLALAYDPHFVGFHLTRMRSNDWDTILGC